MSENTITISKDEYEFLLKCKKRALAVRRAQNAWRNKNAERINKGLRNLYKRKKERKEHE